MFQEIIKNITCEKLVWGGKGFSRLNGKVLLIEGALPGEIVDARVIKQKKDFLESQVIKIIKASPLRVKPVCKHFEKCGGCDWQYLEYNSQLKEKQAIFRETLKRGSGLDLEVSIIRSPLEWRYRSRIQSHWKNSSWQVYPKGKFEGDSLKECLVMEDSLEKFLVEHQNIPMQEGRYSLMSCEKGGVILYDWGKQTVGHTVVNGKKIFFNVRGFFQNNRSLLSDWVDFVTKDLQGESLWDLYAGCGVLSAFLETSFNKIILVETSQVSLKLARRNVQASQYIRSDVSLFLEKQKVSADVVIMNPPRTGLSSNVLLQILRLSPKRLVYISCHAPTFARDMKDLKEKYYIKNSCLFDFYPQTYHIESVFHLERKE